MTKYELCDELKHGAILDDLFEFRWGQDCLIYKALGFVGGNDIIYIPDVSLNEIPIYDPVTDEETIQEILDCCYTRNDFIAECEGDRYKAKLLFKYCDWQHPSSALPEIDEEEDE